MKKFIFQTLVIFVVLASCVDVGQTRNKSTSNKSSRGSESIVTPTSTPAPTPIATIVPARAELRGILDPIDGKVKAKVSIPKNYKGWIYLHALNVASLKSKFVYVKFSFGKDKAEMVFPATVGIPNGVVPRVTYDMLMIDMTSGQLNEVRNLYQLYDYGEYDSNNDGIEDLVPASDALDSTLYCRGLNLSDDSTFIDSDNNGKCDQATDRCLYSYAKITDRSFNTHVSNAPAIDFLAAVPFEAEGRNGASDRWPCLPDSKKKSDLITSLGGSGAVTISGPTTLYGGEIATFVDFGTYVYNGPYLRLDTSSGWQIKASAIFGSKGIFKTAAVGSAEYGSLLFPRTGKIDLKDGVTYLGSTTPFGVRTFTASGGGISNYVDGCTVRALWSSHDDPEKSLGSCNVTATIEILEKSGTSFSKISETNELKLQLTRASKKDSQGNELIVNSMKSCHGANECGSSECCYNKHCLSKNIVSACMGDDEPSGNQGIGESCSSDYDCVSLCCNTSLGTCGVHMAWDDGDEYPVTCSKSPGQSCIAKEWCQRENVSTCMIVKTGIDSETNKITCAVRCYNVPTYGDCIDSKCYPPTVPAYPVFDPANPDCSRAVNPPTNI